MNQHAEQKSENDSQRTDDQRARESGSGLAPPSFVDNRPSAALQRRLQSTSQTAPRSQHTAQLQSVIQKKENKTGLPDNLKSGIESLSGMSMDHVKVHYNSPQPAQLNAHAYAQGADIHVAPGQERHLPHEAWHVVQQAQGRVTPTLQMAGTQINDDGGLEKEADRMGAHAANYPADQLQIGLENKASTSFVGGGTVQRILNAADQDLLSSFLRGRYRGSKAVNSKWEDEVWSYLIAEYDDYRSAVRAIREAELEADDKYPRQIDDNDLRTIAEHWQFSDDDSAFGDDDSLSDGDGAMFGDDESEVPPRFRDDDSKEPLTYSEDDSKRANALSGFDLIDDDFFESSEASTYGGTTANSSVPQKDEMKASDGPVASEPAVDQKYLDFQSMIKALKEKQNPLKYKGPLDYALGALDKLKKGAAPAQLIADCSGYVVEFLNANNVAITAENKHALPNKKNIVKHQVGLMQSLADSMQALAGTPVVRPGDFTEDMFPATTGTDSLGKTHQLGGGGVTRTGQVGSATGQEASTMTASIALNELYKLSFKNAFVAGHLVTRKAAGKAIDSNLTPFSGYFNQGPIRTPEMAAESQIRKNNVISYRAEAVYGRTSRNFSSVNFAVPDLALIPCSVKVNVQKLGLDEGKDGKKIANWNVVESELFDKTIPIDLSDVKSG